MPGKHGSVVVQPGQPLQFTAIADASLPSATAALGTSVGTTLVAYKKAARALLEGKYASQAALAPAYLRESCDIFLVRCPDGMLVRYDSAQNEPGRMRCADVGEPLAKMAPIFSDQIIHFPDDPETYVPPLPGPEVILGKTDAAGGTSELARFRPLIYATTKLPPGFQVLPPPARPPCIISLQNELAIQAQGFVVPNSGPLKPGPDVDHFLLHGRLKLPVGWHTIEIYPPLVDEHWKPEYAALWAELDLLAAIVQQNTVASALSSIDSRGAMRKHYANLLEEFKTLLAGQEEPVHQFLKEHPELICPTAEHTWSKLPFGDRRSDFVFREPGNDYLLVELEAPIRGLFRKDGQQREELTHAINQILDWIQFIGRNQTRVEDELGLKGISTNPRTLIVMGRSEGLTEDNRKKLVTLQSQQNKLRILTYDDLLSGARTNLERLLGPLSLVGQNAEVYFFKQEC
jgi:hypothetical protein